MRLAYASTVWKHLYILLLLTIASCEDSFAANQAAPAAAASPSVTAESKSKIRSINKRPTPIQEGPQQISPEVRNVLESFKVSRDTIIRTVDSRNSGAKYLNETELRSNRDCLIWCWETVNCNVAVFEEKESGSCYLFDCGSSDDNFLCKFTPHAFYTSSILLTSSHVQDLTQWGKGQSVLKKELKDLHQTTTTDAPSLNSMPASVVTTKLPVTKSSTDLAEPRCQHYQFPCQNSSECIAVYNVCDGIPQCPDGSDESEDLSCPKSTSTAKTTVPPQRTSTPRRVVTSEPHPTMDAFQPPDNYKLASDDEPEPPVQIHPQIGGKIFRENNQMYQYSDFPKPPKESSMVQRPDYFLPYDSLYYGRNYDKPQMIQDDNRYWISEPNKPRYPAQVAEGIIQPSQQLQLPVDRYPNYWPVNRPMELENLKQSQIQQPSRIVEYIPYQTPEKSIPTQSKLSLLHHQYPQRPQQQPQQQQQPPQLPPPPPPADQSQVQTQQEKPKETSVHSVMPAKPQDITPVDTNLYYKPVAVVEDEQGSSSLAQHTDSKAEKKKSQEQPASDKDKSVQFDKLRMRLSFTQVEGRAQESGSAILALILGLCVTGLLLVLVGCRLRLVRRRLARRGGKSSLAHDADYLVNGMYL